jgi:hypothetical protein
MKIRRNAITVALNGSTLIAGTGLATVETVATIPCASAFHPPEAMWLQMDAAYSKAIWARSA